MERLYQHRPYMVEGMYVVGVKPKSLGEGVIPVVYSVNYETVYTYWDEHPGYNYAIFRWSQGTLKWVGRRMVNKAGMPYWTPVPPTHLEALA